MLGPPVSDRTGEGSPPGGLPLPFFRGVLASPQERRVSPTLGLALWDLAQGWGAACDALGALQAQQGPAPSHAAAACVWLPPELAEPAYAEAQRIAAYLERTNPGCRVLARLDCTHGLPILLLEIRRG
jgi:hypothetical protein